jgi:type IV secretion system protein TrbL
MDATALDTITQAFVSALQAGQQTLAALSIPLLGVFAIMAFYLQMGPLLASGGASTGDALASLLLLVLKVGVFDWIMFNFSSMATAAFDTFLQWGLSPSGVQLSAGTFQSPSVIVNLGFTAAKPLKLFADRMAGWSAMWNFWTLAPYVLAWWVVVIAFVFVALHLMMTLIEYHMAVLVGTVLVPWGVLQPTAFFTEFSIGWITGGLVRILVTGAIVGIAVPLFDIVTTNTTAGGDPTFYSAIITGITSLVFAILSWVIPGRAAAIAGRGVSLAVHGGTLLAGAAGPLRGVLMIQQVVRGISHIPPNYVVTP